MMHVSLGLTRLIRIMMIDYARSISTEFSSNQCMLV